jgi:hypothetical protein
MLTQNEYKKNQKCPHCEADNGEVYARAPLAHYGQGNVTQKMGCDLCMKNWTDIYKIARYEKSP